MIFIFTEKPKREEILRVLKYIDDFVENIGGGESYWIAPQRREIRN